jgi:hypothetical protein
MLCLAALTHAHAVRIDGLDPIQPVSGRATATVEDGVLRIDLSDERALTVAPWPAHLPQRFDPHELAGSRLLHPAGPVDRLEFRTSTASTPWLVVVTGARSAHEVLAGWALELSEDGWAMRKGGEKRAFGRHAHGIQMARVKTKGEDWCVYLLDTQLARPDSTVEHEYEPQASWAAVRSNAGKCRACR